MQDVGQQTGLEGRDGRPVVFGGGQALQRIQLTSNAFAEPEVVAVLQLHVAAVAVADGLQQLLSREHGVVVQPHVALNLEPSSAVCQANIPFGLGGRVHPQLLALRPFHAADFLMAACEGQEVEHLLRAEVSVQVLVEI